jgi:hypothetical protein
MNPETHTDRPTLPHVQNSTALVTEYTAATAPAVEVELRPWEYSLAAQVGAGRTAANYRKTDAAHYDRSRMEDDRTAQHAAAASELATARAMNRYWTGCGAWFASSHSEFRDLADVGDNVEVRRIREKTGTTFAVGEKDRGRIVVAAYPEPPEFWTVRILGWIEADEAIEIGRPAGYGSRVRVPISALSLRGIE